MKFFFVFGEVLKTISADAHLDRYIVLSTDMAIETTHSKHDPLLLGLGSIMLTSLFSLFYVIGECHRFLHRNVPFTSSCPFFLDIYYLNCLYLATIAIAETPHFEFYREYHLSRP